MAKWICKDEPMIRGDGAAVGVYLAREKELVRCKDCKHRYDGCCYDKKSNRINFGAYVSDEWFCADGERGDVE